MRRLFVSFALAVAVATAANQPAQKLGPAEHLNWTGSFDPCSRRFELLKHTHMNVGVRLSTSKPALAREFGRAMDFWSSVIDMSWYEDQTSSCSLQLVDGTSSILINATIARSQFTDWGNFQGWIAFDPNAPLSNSGMYLTAVHEIGHILGLKHNRNRNSVMYYLDLREREVLDRSDLAALAAHHKLRVSTRTPIRVPTPRL